MSNRYLLGYSTVHMSCASIRLTAQKKLRFNNHKYLVIEFSALSGHDFDH